MRTLLLLFSCTALLAFSACRHEPAATSAVPSEPAPDTVRREPVPFDGAQTYVLTEGTVTWNARKNLGDGHQGTVQLKSGEFLVNRGELLRGKAEIDMTTIQVGEMQDGGEKRTLESHLKDGDFFDTGRYPSALLVFDEVLPSNLQEFNAVLSSELTIKGKTNPVNIPVLIKVNGDELTAQSTTFVINRTQWGINFRSGLLGTTKDKLIEDNIILSVSAKAKRKE